MSEFLQWIVEWVAAAPGAAVAAMVGGSWAFAAVVYALSALLGSGAGGVEMTSSR